MAYAIFDSDLVTLTVEERSSNGRKKVKDSIILEPSVLKALAKYVNSANKKLGVNKK